MADISTCEAWKNYCFMCLSVGMATMDSTDADYLLSVLSKVGLATPALDAHAKLSGRHDEFADIDPEIADFNLPDSNVQGEVLLPFVHSQGIMDHLYGVLAHAFRTRGYRPVVVTCRGSLPECTRKVGRPDTEGACVNCRYKTDTVQDAYGLAQTSLEEYVPPEFNVELPASDEALQSFTYRGVDVAKYALATTRRHRRKYRVDLSNDGDRASFIGNLHTAVRLAEFTHEIIDDHDIAATVANHPAYNYGGVFLATACERGIPAISYSGGYFRKDAMIFGNQRNSKGFTIFSDRESIRQYLEKPLTADEEQEVETYMKGRRDGSTIRNLNNYTNKTSGGANIDTTKPVVGIFSNLLWDGSLSDCSITFDTPFGWVKQTIEYAADRPDLQFILKPHPAEAHRETEEEMVAWVRSNVKIPANVKLLSPDTDVSPYDLIQELDVGIVFNSTIGLEMLYDGIPVITTGDTHYRSLGFTYDPETASEYFDLLDSAAELSLSDNEQALAKRYAHFLLVKRHISLEGINPIEEVRTLSHDKIASDEIFDHIVDRILNDDAAITM